MFLFFIFIIGQLINLFFFHFHIQAYQEDLEADLLLLEENIEKELLNMSDKVRKKQRKQTKQRN